MDVRLEGDGFAGYGAGEGDRVGRYPVRSTKCRDAAWIHQRPHDAKRSRAHPPLRRLSMALSLCRRAPAAIADHADHQWHNPVGHSLCLFGPPWSGGLPELAVCRLHDAGMRRETSAIESMPSACVKAAATTFVTQVHWIGDACAQRPGHRGRKPVRCLQPVQLDAGFRAPCWSVLLFPPITCAASPKVVAREKTRSNPGTGNPPPPSQRPSATPGMVPNGYATHGDGSEA